MKNLVKSFLLFGLLISVIACSNNEVKQSDVEEFVKEYKTQQYAIENYESTPTGNEISEKVKKFLTEDALENLKENRVFSIAPELSNKMNKNIELKSIQIKKESENEDGSVDYSYILEIKLYDDQDSKVYEKNGEFTIINNDNELKITRDWEANTEFENNIL